MHEKEFESSPKIEVHVPSPKGQEQSSEEDELQVDSGDMMDDSMKIAADQEEIKVKVDHMQPNHR